MCLPGWQNEKHYCREPICDPPCVAGQGNCTRPNHCECGIGWTHSDCSKCVCLPGCVNGYCQTPFECKCEPGWTGMFCDKRRINFLFCLALLFDFDDFQLFVRKVVNMVIVASQENACKSLLEFNLVPVQMLLQLPSRMVWTQL